MMLKKNAGTTLIEVLVASGILVSIITLLTVALTSTFEGYSRVLSSAQVEQDAQYITARLQYATTRADRNTLALHTTSTDFSTGALSFAVVTTTAGGEIAIESEKTQGAFTSAPITLANDETVRSFTSSASLPANTSIGYQIGVRSPIASVCPTDSNLYGYAWDTTTSSPLSSAPIAWYKMDETTWNGTAGEVVNSSTNSYNGTSSGGAYTTAEGMRNRAGRFDGTDDYVGAAVPMTQTDNWTLSAWIYPSTLPQLGTVVSNGNDNNSVGDGYAFGIGSGSGTSGSKLQGVNSGVAFIDSGYTFPAANAWYHVVMERSSGTIKFYVNGVQTANTSASVPTTPTVFRIGSQTGIRFFNGLIDDVRIYNYARSQTNIITDMNNYQPRPASPIAWWKLDETSGPSTSSASSGNTGTWSGNTASTAGKYSNGITLDGSADYVSISAVTGNTATQTVELWMYVVGAVGGNQYAIDQGGNNNWIQVYQSKVRAGNSGSDYCDGNTTVTTNTWYHVAKVFDGSTLRVYLNGVLDCSKNNAAGNTPSSIRIGGYSGGLGYELNGKVDDVRLYNYARTQAQIVDDMNGVDPVNVVDYFALPTGTYGLPTPSPTPNYSNPGQCIIYKTTYTRSQTSDTSPQTLDVTIKK